MAYTVPTTTVPDFALPRFVLLNHTTYVVLVTNTRSFNPFGTHANQRRMTANRFG